MLWKLHPENDHLANNQPRGYGVNGEWGQQVRSTCVYPLQDFVQDFSVQRRDADVWRATPPRESHAPRESHTP